MRYARKRLELLVESWMTSLGRLLGCEIDAE